MLLERRAEAVSLTLASEGACASSVWAEKAARCSPHAVSRTAGYLEPTVLFSRVGERELLKTSPYLKEGPVTPTKL